MKKSLPLLALSALLTASAGAGVINGSFDSGLTGWTTLGDVSVVTGAAYLTNAKHDAPFDDATALNNTGFAVADTFSLEAFAGLGAGALDPDAGNGVFAFEGSGLKQSITVNAGDLLSFDWRIFANEQGADYAYVVIGGTKFDLGTAAIATNSSSPFAFESELATFSHTFATGGTFDLSLGIVDVNDYVSSSALRVDNLVVVPEPSTSLFGLAMLGACYRRVRTRQKAA